MADLARYHTAHAITRVTHDSGRVVLYWDDGRVSRFPAEWLRDNCPCPRCRHPQALERTYLFIDHPPPAIGEASVDDQGDLEVRFEQQGERHVTRFAPGWLRERCCSPEALAERAAAPEAWDTSIRSRLPTVAWTDYMNGNAGMRAWIEALIDPMYAALGTLWRMLRDPRYHLDLRLEAGDLIAYDNNRVLHGRAAFDVRTGERHLQGCYLNAEDLASRQRLLDRA